MRTYDTEVKQLLLRTIVVSREFIIANGLESEYLEFFKQRMPELEIEQMLQTAYYRGETDYNPEG